MIYIKIFLFASFVNLFTDVSLPSFFNFFMPSPVTLSEDGRRECSEGYLTGNCTFSLECLNSGGFQSTLCKSSFLVKVCCTKRTTVSVLPESTKKAGEKCFLIGRKLGKKEEKTQKYVTFNIN